MLGWIRPIYSRRYLEVSYQSERQGCYRLFFAKAGKVLIQKSIERRKKQGLKIDSTDLPVCKKYVDAIRRKGVHILVTGKWENFVTVSCNDSVLIDEIARLPFVRSAERVWKGNMEKLPEEIR